MHIHLRTSHHVLALMGFLLLAAGNARSELIANGFYKINRTDVLVTALSDQQRPSSTAVRNAVSCANEGKRMVLASVGNMRLGPRTIPYASGCWHFTGSVVMLELVTLDEGRQITLRMPLSDFDTTPKFTRWTDYGISLK